MRGQQTLYWISGGTSSSQPEIAGYRGPILISSGVRLDGILMVKGQRNGQEKKKLIVRSSGKAGRDGICQLVQPLAVTTVYWMENQSPMKPYGEITERGTG